jgi:hypothetical protein
MSQPRVELARGLALDSLALAKEPRSPLKLIGSGRRLVELANGDNDTRNAVSFSTLFAIATPSLVSFENTQEQAVSFYVSLPA